MRRVKSDRWDNLIERLPDDNGWVRSVDAATLLRREHRALVRMVKARSINSNIEAVTSDYLAGYERFQRDILELLKRREA